MQKITLVSVYSVPGSKKVLYSLLKEREPKESISAKKIPSFRQHCTYVDKRRYKAWYLIRRGKDLCGAMDLSDNGEVGIFLFKKFKGRGIGRQAFQSLLGRHPEMRRFVAHVNPANKRSIAFFKKFKFKHVQNTYELLRGKRKTRGKS